MVLTAEYVPETDEAPAAKELPVVEPCLEAPEPPHLAVATVVATAMMIQHRAVKVGRLVMFTVGGVRRRSDL